MLISTPEPPSTYIRTYVHAYYLFTYLLALSHTVFHIPLCHTQLFYLVDPSPPPLSFLPSPSPLQPLKLSIGRSWLVGLSGPLIRWRSAESFGFGASCSEADFQRNMGPLELLCPSVRGSLCRCFGLFCWEFGDAKTFGNHTAFICFPVGSLCRDIQPCTKVMGFDVFLKNKSSKPANGTLFLFGYGPKLGKH